DVPPRGSGVSLRGRIPGKINLNTVFDFETFAALCDRSPSNLFTDVDVQNAWNALITRRSPGVPVAAPAVPSLTQNDKPILDLTTGLIPSGDMPTGAVSEGRSLDDTVMRWKDPSNTSARRLLQTGHAHPYYANELLHKVSANITNRSNVFAVWLTVAFFEVVDDPSTGRVNL